MRCGSVWTCPLCASILSERRRLEIQTAVKNWQALGGNVVMLTLTVPHTVKDTLPNILKQFMFARRTQKNSKPFKKWAARNLHGSITALETTYGDNGWHVHTHEILFLNPSFVEDHNNYIKNNRLIYTSFNLLKQHAKKNKQRLPKEPFLKILQDSLFPTWETAALTAGFSAPSEHHGLDISDSDEVAGYAAKWGLDLELTKTHLKNSRKNGRTPWAILNDFLDFGDCDDASLFTQFAKHFKGKNQLHWTKALKKSLSITDLTDTEIIEQSEHGEVVFTLTLSQWRLVLASNTRAQLLETVNALGSQSVEPFLNELMIKHFSKKSIGNKLIKPKKQHIKL